MVSNPGPPPPNGSLSLHADPPKQFTLTWVRFIEASIFSRKIKREKLRDKLQTDRKGGEKADRI